MPWCCCSMLVVTSGSFSCLLCCSCFCVSHHWLPPSVKKVCFFVSAFSF
ncbi:hypothetical protein GLYMA_14G151150v4 [Glycine max]|nr:hypothetical protein GLYMA_14G151150v4 [Glycine max]KAH1094580.1 hypothetical protein GYH30_040040 [Glycine max]